MGLSWIEEAVVFLAATVITVPLFRRAGVGAVLGYLVAGMLIGPQLLGLINNVNTILHFADLGVVLLLFVIGLELQPTRLWTMRRSVFGLGSAQVLLTGLILAGAALALRVPPASALVVGLTLALSSTALALQLLAEKKQLAAPHGRSAFAILLFQDLAAIPLLAIVPLLGADVGNHGWHVMGALRVIAAIAGVILIGRQLLRPYLRLAASADNHEVFIAATLLVVVGTALLMQQIGLSMALGSFLAGVLLADSEYRHELEADIKPFSGLLLGLFFIAIGMSVDLRLVIKQPFVVTGLTLGLMLIKGLSLYVVARLGRHEHGAAARLALSLPQGGEFAFVLFGVAAGARVIDDALSNMLIVIVSMSLVLTPLLVTLNDKVFRIGHGESAREFDSIEPHEHRVIIAGFGRFGQVVARMLRMKQIPFTVLESSFEQVEFVRKFGAKIYFGDASRLDLLDAAHAAEAEVFVLAIDDVEASVRTAEMVRRHYPHLKIYARARNRVHAYRLMDTGVDMMIRETFLSSLELARGVLVALGRPADEADKAARLFLRHDEDLLVRQHEVYKDEAQLIASVKQGAAELERLFGEDTEVSRD